VEPEPKAAQVVEEVVAVEGQALEAVGYTHRKALAGAYT